MQNYYTEKNNKEPNNSSNNSRKLRPLNRRKPESLSENDLKDINKMLQYLKENHKTHYKRLEICE